MSENVFMSEYKNEEFVLDEYIGMAQYYKDDTRVVEIKFIKEFIKIIEFDLLKKYKKASIPIMEIIKKRAGEKLI